MPTKSKLSVLPKKNDMEIFGGPTSANPESWMPFEFPHSRGTTSPGRQLAGELYFFRTKGSGSHTLLTGVWRTSPISPGCDPKTGECRFPWECPYGDEQIYVIEGSCTITNNDTGEVRTYKPGDVFSITKGTDTDWVAHGPFFKKFFCITHSDPTDLDTASFPILRFADVE